MGEERQLKRVMNAEMEGRRPDGRPRTRWKDVLRRDLASSGLSLGEAATDGRLSCWPFATTAPWEVKTSQSQQPGVRMSPTKLPCHGTSSDGVDHSSINLCKKTSSVMPHIFAPAFTLFTKSCHCFFFSIQLWHPVAP